MMHKLISNKFEKSLNSLLSKFKLKNKLIPSKKKRNRNEANQMHFCWGFRGLKN